MVKVIGAGLGRTGSFSLRAALERLGFGPCHHMASLGENPGLIDEWESVVRGDPVDWPRLLAGFGSTVDWPSCAYWRELADAFPQAKVVLTVRDPDRWYDSARSTICRYTAPQRGIEGLLTRMENRLYPELGRRRELCRKLVWDGTFGGRFAEREHALNIFRRHNDTVRTEIPADRLLVFEVRQGWEPLCSFLGVEVPDEPFPHLNDSESFRRTASERRFRALTFRRQITPENSAIR
ncbi:sulfotransferase family protein [Streptomonospora nanhaiensis]|uniref:sulfotransferase family protein n=1 Tax=Streptomonospora nanhaiensis TaxID=1323731 RepID=UPI001FE3851E|nr:sulfotransferase family protein [Streptomonospora nanhaiensis]